MVKGKYAARAATRAATLDNEIIAELRGKLNLATSERDKLLRELDSLKGRISGEVNARVDAALLSERVALTERGNRINDELMLEKEAVASALVQFVRAWFDDLQEMYDTEAVLPRWLFDPEDERINIPAMLNILGMGKDSGELMHQMFHGLDSTSGPLSLHSRRGRRRSAAKITSDVRRAKDKEVRDYMQNRMVGKMKGDGSVKEAEEKSS